MAFDRRDRIRETCWQQVSVGPHNGLGTDEIVHQLDLIVLRSISSDTMAVLFPFDKAENLFRIGQRPGLRADGDAILPWRVALLHHGPVSLIDQLADLIFLGGRLDKTLPDEITGCQYPVFVRSIGVSLGENSQPVSQARVGCAVAPLGGECCPVGVVSTQVAVIISLQAGLFLELAGELGKEFRAGERNDPGVARRVLGTLIRDRVAVVRPVGRMGIDEEMRFPGVEEPDESTSLRPSSLMKSRFKSSPRALARWPIPASGPTCPGRFWLDTRSLPSAL